MTYGSRASGGHTVRYCPLAACHLGRVSSSPMYCWALTFAVLCRCSEGLNGPCSEGTGRRYRAEARHSVPVQQRERCQTACRSIAATWHIGGSSGSSSSSKLQNRACATRINLDCKRTQRSTTLRQLEVVPRYLESCQADPHSRRYARCEAQRSGKRARQEPLLAPPVQSKGGAATKERSSSLSRQCSSSNGTQHAAKPATNALGHTMLTLRLPSPKPPPPAIASWASLVNCWPSFSTP